MCSLVTADQGRSQDSQFDGTLKRARKRGRENLQTTPISGHNWRVFGAFESRC